jgi:hypothetical protein
MLHFRRETLDKLFAPQYSNNYKMALVAKWDHFEFYFPRLTNFFHFSLYIFDFVDSNEFIA